MVTYIARVRPTVPVQASGEEQTSTVVQCGCTHSIRAVVLRCLGSAVGALKMLTGIEIASGICAG